jgi:hypothetical protein
MAKIALGLLTALGFFGAAQAAEPPQYNGVFEAHDPRTGAYSELERAAPTLHTRMRAFGFGGGSATEDIPGPRSPIRFRAGTPIEFIVRETSRENDPNTIIQFVSLTSEANDRYFEMYNAGALGGMKNTSAKSAVGFSANNYKDAYFKVVPSQPLPPGEYALTITGSPAVMTNGMPPAYCFGVDP